MAETHDKRTMDAINKINRLIGTELMLGPHLRQKTNVALLEEIKKIATDGLKRR